MTITIVERFSENGTISWITYEYIRESGLFNAQFKTVSNASIRCLIGKHTYLNIKTRVFYAAKSAIKSSL